MTNETAPTPRYRPRDSLKRLGITFSILFVLWLVFAYAVPYLFHPRVSVPSIPVVEHPALAPAPDVSARIEALEARVKMLEEKPASAPVAEAPAPDPRVNDLSAQVLSQQNVVDDLKKAMEEGNRRLVALTLFGQLKEAALSGNPYRHELHEFTALMQGEDSFVPLLAKLSPFTENGLPSLSQLQKGFANAMTKTLSPKSGAWSEKMHALVRIRKVGEVEGVDDEAVLARAETKLQQGNFAQTLKELEQLSPPAADAMNEWKKQAAGYMDAKKALDALQVALFKPSVAAP